MFCKWCGLESETTDVCSWCRQPFTTAAVESPPSPSPLEEEFSPFEPSAPASKSTPVAVAQPPASEDDDLPPIARAVPPPAPPAPDFRRPQPDADDRPDLTAIPIKRAPSGAPPVIPISKPPPRPISEPPSAAPPPAAQPQAIPAQPPPPRPALPDSGIAAPSARAPQPLGDMLEEEPQIGAAPARPGAQGVSGRTSPSQAGAATATRPGVRVFCRWCGMESENPDVCTWCRREIIKPTSRTVEALKRGPTPVKKGPQRREVRPSPPAASEGNGNGAAVAVPAIGTFTAQKSRYYPEKVYDPVSGAHYDADTGEAEAPPRLGEDFDQDAEPIYPLNQLAKNLAVLIGLAVLGALLVQSHPEWYLSLLGVTNFMAGMIMPLIRTVPFGDDDSTDIGVVIGLILILGPLVGAILYFFYCFVKQDFSPGMVGVFVSYLVLRFALDAVLGVPVAKIMPWSEFTPETIGAQIMPFVTIAGWYAADIFHKPDE